jgi:peptidoglycan/LPS O-acetylase OafA/YrhL
MIYPGPIPVQRHDSSDGNGITIPAALSAGKITSALRHVPELDGLRGVAILMVLFYHSCADAPRWAQWLLQYGWAGVDLFFVLSGFLITSILVRTKDSPEYFRSFYVRRILRIFPLYYLAMFLFFGVLLPLRHANGASLEISSGEQIWYWTYLVNWHDSSRHMVSPLIHIWSLCVEEQFYLIWPLVIWVCRRKQIPLACLGVGAISFCARLVFELLHADPEFLHRATINRLDTLAAGAFLAAVMDSEYWTAKLKAWIRPIFPLALAALITLWFILHYRPNIVGSYALGYLLLAGVSASMVFYCRTRTGGEKPRFRLLRCGFLRSFGKFSYSIYIFHLFVYAKVRPPALAFMKSLPPSISGPLAVLVCILAAWLVGLLTWHIFEKHFLKLKDRFAYWTDPRTQAASRDSNVETIA